MTNEEGEKGVMELITLDETIRYAEETAEEESKMFKQYDDAKHKKWSAEWRQLREWLKDYKRLLELEVCGDAISREEAEQSMIKLCDPQLGEWAQNPHIDAILDALENVPSVMIAKTRPKMGRSIRWSEQKEVVSDTNVGDMVSRQAALDAISRIGLSKSGTDEVKPVTECLRVVEDLPPARSEIIRCGQCKYAEVADKEDAQDGYTCQFHRGSVWFSGSYCSWAERRTDG